MFTGIIEEQGLVEAMEDQGDAVRLTVRGPRVTSDAALGDSISVKTTSTRPAWVSSWLMRR